MHVHKLSSHYNFFAALIIVFACGCGDTIPKVPTYAEAEAQAKKEFAPHVPAETRLSLDGGLADVKKESALAPGAPAPSGGTFMTPNRYAVYKTIAVDRELLIKKYTAEAVTARVKTIILDATNKALQVAAKRSWWEKNAVWVGLAVGFVAGTALTVGLVYGLTGGDGVK